MKISTKTRYAIRFMFQLALDYGKGPSMLGDIAKREDLSEKYLSIIVISLRSQGLISSTRGSKGGYSLARHPSKITIKDIYEATDGKVCTVDCTASKKNCKKSADCVVREFWLKLDNSISDVMEGTTLQDILESYQKKNKHIVNYEI